jgi:toxin ParE1/3/4
MSRYKIEITEPAENDLFEIGNYISKVLLESEIANKIVDKIAEAIIKLEELPLRNALIGEERLASQGIRRIIVENYIIFYVVDEKCNKVTIVRILYSRRDWVSLL